jgi:hypothetical protein
MLHIIPFKKDLPALSNNTLLHCWSNEWKAIDALNIDQFRSESHKVRPLTQLKLVHDGKHFEGLFKVCESGVISRETQQQGAVWRDSCVEIFLQPPRSSAYFNVEFNAGGCIHASWITDWQRNREGDVTAREFLKTEELERIQVFHSLPERIEKPLMELTEWYLGFVIPVNVLQHYVPMDGLSRTTWRGNVYKCAEHGPYPHWASWSPLTQLNFHAPNEFGEFIFAETLSETL